LPAWSRAAPIRDAGEGNRHKGSRNQRRGASDESPGERQSQFALLTAAVRSWSPKPSLLRGLAAPIRDTEEGTGHKGSRNQRRGASGESPDERQSQFALVTAAIRSWSPKPSLLRSPGAPIRDTGEGNRHKGSRNQRRGASCESPRERQSEFALPWRRSQIMAPNVLIPHDGSVCRPTNPTGQSERLSPSSPL
jgi:hypothetical protein